MKELPPARLIKRKQCKHNRRKYECVECGGSQICLHKKQKSQCKKCKGSQICAHNKFKSNCKTCLGKEKALSLTLRKMVSSTKSFDKKQRIYDPTHHVDKEFLLRLFKSLKSMQCHYFKKHYNNIIAINLHDKDSLLTIQRLNNKFGHTKSNVVFACYQCNVRKKINWYYFFSVFLRGTEYTSSNDCKKCRPALTGQIYIDMFLTWLYFGMRSIIRIKINMCFISKYV